MNEREGPMSTDKSQAIRNTWITPIPYKPGPALEVAHGEDRLTDQAAPEFVDLEPGPGMASLDLALSAAPGMVR